MTEKIMALMKDTDLVENRIKWLDTLKELFDGEYRGPVILTGRVGRHHGSLSCPDQGETFYDDPCQALEIGLEDLATQIEQLRSGIYDAFMPWTLEADWYGVHLVDKIFGAEVFYDEGARQWYNRYLKIEAGTLERPDLETSLPWRQVKNYALAFLALDMTVPLLGTPVLSSPLNIAVNLFGADFLVTMIEEPEAARHDLQIIYGVIKDLHRWYLSNIPMERLQPTVSPWRTQPVGFGQLCGCSTHLLSPRLYEEFVMPLDDELLSLWPHGGMIHLCGSHKHLIPLFAQMPHLRAVQLNDLAADQLKEYADGLREDQVIYMSPTQNMPLEKTLEVAKGRRMVYVGQFKPADVGAITL